MLGHSLPTPKFVHSGNGIELVKAYRLLKFPTDTSQPHRPATKGVVERAQRSVKEGTSCLLSQAGLQPEWWVEAILCFCFLLNVYDTIPLGENAGCTAYQARFKEECKAKLAHCC